MSELAKTIQAGPDSSESIGNIADLNASYEPAEESGEGTALKTRPGAKPFRPR
jgi:hypothetical protein